MFLPEKPKIIIAGSVNSSLVTLQKLIEHNCQIVGVLGLHPNVAKNVSGYVDLRPCAIQKDIPFQYFSKINDQEVYNFAQSLDVDLFFVIGLSQLVREPLLSLATYGNVGFHPTRLPEGRGRGAVAWMILGQTKGAATFFMLDEGMDSGPILGQKEFEVEKQDYAEDVIEKIKRSIAEVLDNILPKLNQGELKLRPQDHSKASYLGRRKPKDGKIDWQKRVEKIHQLIRATSRPLPGAFSYWKKEKLIIYKASAEYNNRYIGVPGRILEVNGDRFLVACGEGALWIDDFETTGPKDFRVGADLE